MPTHLYIYIYIFFDVWHVVHIEFHLTIMIWPHAMLDGKTPNAQEKGSEILAFAAAEQRDLRDSGQVDNICPVLSQLSTVDPRNSVPGLYLYRYFPQVSRAQPKV